MHLVIAKIDETLYDGEVYSLTAPGVAGEMTVLGRHEPLITTLKAGALRVQGAAGWGRTVLYEIDLSLARFLHFLEHIADLSQVEEIRDADSTSCLYLHVRGHVTRHFHVGDGFRDVLKHGVGADGGGSF